MKKLTAALTALLICSGCIPFLSGCSAETQFTLKEDGNGEKYYSVKCAGVKNSLSGEYVIPDSYGEGEDRAPVREIEAEGFAGTRITKITVPSTVTVIGNAAFAYCYSLTEVVFSEGTELGAINRGTFGYCENLVSINVPNTVKSIGPLAFAYCSDLRTLALPDGLESIAVKAFYYSGLYEVIIPDTVSDKTVPVLGDDGEQKKDEDGKTLTSTVHGIGYAAFHSCVYLKRAVIGSGVTVIRGGAFGYCPSLEEVYLPATLEKVEGAHYADGGEEGGIKEGIFYCGHAFHSATALKDVHYAGTAEQWKILSGGIDNKPVTESGTVFSNDALLSAELHLESAYEK